MNPRTREPHPYIVEPEADAAADALLTLLWRLHLLHDEIAPRVGTEVLAHVAGTYTCIEEELESLGFEILGTLIEVESNAGDIHDTHTRVQ